MNKKQNDMEIIAAIIKARELLGEIPGVDSIIGAWDVYCAHMDGPWVAIGPDPEDGFNTPNPQDQKIGLKMLAGIYSRLAPFEDRIVSLFNILDLAHMSILDEVVRNKLSFLNCYCSEFHTYQITMMELGLLDGQEQQRKQSTKSKRRSGTDAANKLSALTGIYQKLQDKEFIVNGRWTGSPACFWTLVYELNINHEIDNGGLAWVDVARWVGVPADEMEKLMHSAQVGFDGNKSKKARGLRAAELRIICQK